MIDKWDSRFLKLAQFVAQWSKDPSTQTGAVIVRPNKTVASLGFNGFPAKMLDKKAFYTDRTEKYSRIIHCEMNAVLHSEDKQLQGYTLFTWPFISCDRCAVHMLTAGITRFVFPTPSADALSRWKESIERTHEYFTEANVEVCEINLDVDEDEMKVHELDMSGVPLDQFDKPLVKVVANG